MPLVKLTGITSFSVCGETVEPDEKGIGTVSDESLASVEFADLRKSLSGGQSIELAPEAVNTAPDAQNTAKDAQGKRKGS